MLPERTASPDLRRSRTERRALRSAIFTAGAWFVALIASVPLFSVLYMLIIQGGSRVSLDLFTELPPAGFELGGGFGNAIVGTLVMVALAALISIPPAFSPRYFFPNCHRTAVWPRRPVFSPRC
jgi:phosphate transport system permease protein